MGEARSPQGLIIGGGPSGLAAAACLKASGVAARLVDRRGEPGGAFREIYRGITLLSPARYTNLPLLPLNHPREYVTVPEYRDYLLRYADHFRLSPERASVQRIERTQARFRVTFAGSADPVDFDFVVVATGMFDFPVRPEIEGLPPNGSACGDRPEVLHARDWPGPERFQGQRLLIVGGATGAVELAEECARSGLPVAVSVRSRLRIAPQRFLGRDLHDYAYAAFRFLPRWLLGSFCNRRPTLPGTDLGFRGFRREGVISVRGPIAHVAGRTVHFRDGALEEFDAIVLATGYQFEMPFLPHEVARATAGHPLADGGESRSWPGLYFIGTPCGRSLASEYLRGISQDAVAMARRIAP